MVSRKLMTIQSCALILYWTRPAFPGQSQTILDIWHVCKYCKNNRKSLNLRLTIFLCFFFFRFCVGDKFYLCDNKILCEYDYEERMVFANMTYNYNALSQIKRQTNSLSDDLSSGYGSPSPGSL